jgi:hypothetical protein
MTPADPEMESAVICLKTFFAFWLSTIVVLLWGCDCEREQWCEQNKAYVCGILGGEDLHRDCNLFAAECRMMKSTERVDDKEAFPVCTYPADLCEADQEYRCKEQVVVDCIEYELPTVSAWENCRDDGQYCVESSSGTTAICSPINERCAPEDSRFCPEIGQPPLTCRDGIWDSNPWDFSICCVLTDGSSGTQWDTESPWYGVDTEEIDLSCQPMTDW